MYSVDDTVYFRHREDGKYRRGVVKRIGQLTVTIAYVEGETTLPYTANMSAFTTQPVATVN